MTRPHADRRSKLAVREVATPHHLSRSIWIYLALLVGIVAIYGQTIRYDFLNYDDPEYVTDAHVRSGLTLPGITWAFKAGYSSNSFPLTWISHMLDFQLFGVHSGAHHLVSVVLHALSTLVLFAFLKRATGAVGRSAFVAFVFALHPLHVESVAWIAERKDVLCVVFWMLALWAYARYTERPSVARYATVTALFCCGLMSKPLIVTFPFIALLMDWWPLRRFASQPARWLFLEKVPLIALTLCASVGTYIAQQHQGAIIAVRQIPIALRVQNAFLSYVLYLRDFVWPSNLAVFYPYLERPAWLILAAAVAMIATTVMAARNVRRRPYLAVGWFWYLGTLIPEIGLVQAGSQSRADRYTYISLIGISIIVAWGAAELFEKRGWSRRLLVASAAGLCAAWTVVAWIDVQYWRNSVALFTHALEITDANYVAYNNLGAALRQDGKIREAIEDFDHVIAILPDDAEAQDNLGEALTAEGRFDEAAPHLLEAVRLRPGFAKAHIDLGAVLLRTGHTGDAEAQYRIAVRLHPTDAAARYGLGGVLMSEGRDQEARAHLKEALPLLIAEVQMNPEGVDGLYNLGTLYGLLGRTDEAILEFSQVLRLRPGDAQARFNLGTVLASRNRLNEAASQFAEAVELAPDFPAAHFSLGRVYGALGRYDDAAREYREALRLNPTNADARRQLEAITGRLAR